MWSETVSRKSCCLVAVLCLLLCGCAGKETEEAQLVSRNGAPVVQLGEGCGEITAPGQTRKIN